MLLFLLLILYSTPIFKQNVYKQYKNLYVEILDDSDKDVLYELFTKTPSSDKSILSSDVSSVVNSTPLTSSFVIPKNNKLLFNNNNIEKLHGDFSSKQIL